MREIRVLTPADLAAVYTLECAAQAFPWSQTLLGDCFGLSYHNAALLVQEQLVGFSLARRVVDEMELLNLAIHPSLQQQGLGHYLLAQQLQQWRDAGVQCVYLEVRATNQPALRLYQRVGFTPFSTRVGYYPSAAGREDACCMRLTLR